MIRRTAVLATTLCLLAGCRWDGSDGRDHNPMNQPGYALPSAAAPGHTVRGPENFLGDRATFELAGGSEAVKVTVADLDGKPRVVKALELSGVDNVLFRRNSVTGAVEAVPWHSDGVALNAALHAN